MTPQSQPAARMGVLVGTATFVILVVMRDSWQRFTLNITPNTDDGNSRHFFQTMNFTGENTRIFYNRVPKCGSRSVYSVMVELASRNDFHVEASRKIFPYNLSENAQIKEVNLVNNLPEHAVYNRHLHFLDFKKFGGKQPTYMNVIRDPIERAISHRFYINSLKNLTLTFDDCVSQRMFECVGTEAIHFTVPFFCGQDPLCNTPSRESLMLAKRNVENYYAIVGLTEDITAFMQVAEVVLPRHFEGATDIYTEIGKTRWQKTATSSKGSASASTRARLAELMHLDIEFYLYIKKRFYEAKRIFTMNR